MPLIILLGICFEEEEMESKNKSAFMCIGAFLLGWFIITLTGCAAANKTQTRVFGCDVEFGGGLYLEESEPDWK